MRHTRLGFWTTASVIAASVLVTSKADAQQGVGVLTGRVLDASTKAPVADAVVTVTSPALQGEQTVVTDSNGSFRVQNLPPGQYTIRLDKETYRPYSRGGVDLRADMTLRLDAALLPESLKEEIVVEARNPTVDVGTSNTGLNIQAEMTKRVPMARPDAIGGAVRSFEAVAAATPQAQGDSYGTAINGTTSPETSFVVDGLQRNNAAFGINGARLSMEFVREVNVITGGYMPEYGMAGGGIVSAVTKQGSNEFHGGAWFFVTPGFLEGDRKRIRRAQTINTQPSLGGIGDVGVEIGGPIIKDKLWFYAGFIAARNVINMDRSLYSSRSGEISETRRQYDASREDFQIFGKLTYTLNARNRFSVTAYTMPSTSGGSGKIAIDPQRGVPNVANIAGTIDALGNTIVTNTTSVQGEWATENQSKKALLKTTVGWMRQSEGTRAADGTMAGDNFGLAAVPGVSWRRNDPGLHGIADFEPVAPWLCDAPNAPSATLCPVTTYRSGGPGFLSEATMDRFQGRSVLTLLAEGLGHHVIKMGVEADVMRYDSIRAYSGKVFLRETADGGAFEDNRDYSYLTAPDQRVLLSKLHWTTHSIMVGGFAQDSWSIADKVTVNGGLRYDSQLLYGGDGKLTMSLPNQISPRVGVIFDPTQQGRAKLFVNYARYYQMVPLNIMDRAGSSEPQVNASRTSATCDPRDAGQLTGACLDPNNNTVINNRASPDQKYAITGAGKTPIDKDIKPQYSDEIVLGGEFDILKNARLGATYTHREQGRVIEDISRDEAQSYFITNPGYAGATDFPKAERIYDAGTLYFQKTFANNWEAQLSYTISYVRGNWVGFFRPETLQLDPGINADFDLESLTRNRKGPLPGDQRHQIRLFGSKTIEFGPSYFLSLGGAFRARSGEPTSYLGSHNLYGPDEVFILPRGEGNRLPWQFNIDTTIGFGTRFGKDKEQSITATLDIFNLFNFQEIILRDERYTNSDVNPLIDKSRGDLGQLQHADGTPFLQNEVNPNFGNPLQYQLPRQIRVGVRATF